MDFKHNTDNIATARMLRKAMTKEEKHLWYDFLCKYPVKFTRQKILGKYIADFYCAKARLIVELDGSQHYSEVGKAADEIRTQYLSEQFGIKVIRFRNAMIWNSFRFVCRAIDDEVKGRAPT